MRQDSHVIKRRCHHASDTTDRQKAWSAEAGTCGTGSHANLEAQDFPMHIKEGNFDRLNLIIVLWTLIMISNDCICVILNVKKQQNKKNITLFRNFSQYYNFRPLYIFY